MNKKTAIRFLALLVACASSAAGASQMTYTPVNPDFGGSPFNGSVLLGEANAQNQYTAKQQPSTQYDPNSPNNIASLITSELVNTIASQLISQFTAGQTGSVVQGNDRFDFKPEGDGKNEMITITDILNGQTTTIEVPCATAC